MNIMVGKGDKHYSLIPGKTADRRKTFSVKEGNEVLCTAAEYIVEETSEDIKLYSRDIRCTFEEEFGVEYPVFAYAGTNLVLSYNKTDKIIVGEYEENIEELVYVEQFGEFINRVIFNTNKYMYAIYCSELHWHAYYGWSMPKRIALNTIKFINEGVFSQLESLIKNLGLEFFTSNIGREDFTLNNAKKLHRVVELPKQAIEFLKDKEFADLLSYFRILAADDPNEAIALVEWYEKYKKYQNVKKGLQEFKGFVGLLVEIKQKNDKVTLNRLLPYLAAQRLYFCWPVEDKFELPYSEAREYRDYLNLGGGELYPSCLEAAHNIATRNKNIANNKELCDKFAEVVKPLKALEWVHDGYAIVAPVQAQDFVDEGEALHHCLATYVELVANGSEKVMFLRNEATPQESLVTFAFDDNFDIVEAKEAFNMDVEDAKILKVLQDWKKKQRAAASK